MDIFAPKHHSLTDVLEKEEAGIVPLGVGNLSKVISAAPLTDDLAGFALRGDRNLNFSEMLRRSSILTPPAMIVPITYQGLPLDYGQPIAVVTKGFNFETDIGRGKSISACRVVSGRSLKQWYFAWQDNKGEKREELASSITAIPQEAFNVWFQKLQRLQANGFSWDTGSKGNLIVDPTSYSLTPIEPDTSPTGLNYSSVRESIGFSPSAFSDQDWRLFDWLNQGIAKAQQTFPIAETFNDELDTRRFSTRAAVLPIADLEPLPVNAPIDHVARLFHETVRWHEERHPSGRSR